VGADFDESEVKELMDALDTNQSGFIDYTEFLAGCMRSKIYMKEDILRTAFEFFDVDKSGFITIDELRQVLGSDEMKLPENEIEILIKEVDINNDNQVDYKEFFEMMRKN
jgi:calcium-dependent protein kinase